MLWRRKSKRPVEKDTPYTLEEVEKVIEGAEQIVISYAKEENWNKALQYNAGLMVMRLVQKELAEELERSYRKEEDCG